MHAALGGVGPQLAAPAETFVRSAWKGQQKDGEGVEQEQAVAALGIVDPQFAPAHAKAQIACVARSASVTGSGEIAFTTLAPRR